MTSEHTQWGQPDSARIDVNRPHELNFWTEQLDVDEATLKEAVKEAGPSVSAVMRQLDRWRAHEAKLGGRPPDRPVS
jgi:hypothetical protein